MLTNQAVNSVYKQCPDNLFYAGKVNTHKTYGVLKEFGWIGYVTIRSKQPKLEEKSIRCVFLGPSSPIDHANGAYRMYNPVTNHVIDTQDVKWSAWHGSNNPLKMMDKIYERQAAEVPEETETEAPNPAAAPEGPDQDN